MHKVSDILPVYLSLNGCHISLKATKTSLQSDRSSEIVAQLISRLDQLLLVMYLGLKNQCEFSHSKE